MTTATTNTLCRETESSISSSLFFCLSLVLYYSLGSKNAGSLLFCIFSLSSEHSSPFLADLPSFPLSYFFLFHSYVWSQLKTTWNFQTEFIPWATDISKDSLLNSLWFGPPLTFLLFQQHPLKNRGGQLKLRMRKEEQGRVKGASISFCWSH